ncbi:hypothetical protein SAMN02745135_02138 [Caloranaerobacter azorensis DSM 13643]|uniref:Uncharacterized protein n=1 Tax=Caloranaerobacter azorensis DSM 13643 TaxID=1121264 RepID=A0A1M5VVG0_9FIRM|nr:hypothetical protein [Caloranaerobacter azorensis]SHH78923.1 hypothetical protein SAMN02745135_02138 [Caloranaerobacter azorensis DSM 13643]
MCKVKKGISKFFEELVDKEYYTRIKIFTNKRVNVRTVQDITRALSRVSEIENIELRNKKYISITCKLNEWTPNYYRKIQKNFRDRVKNMVIKLIERTKLDSYSLSIYRCELDSNEVTDEFHIDVSKEQRI